MASDKLRHLSVHEEEEVNIQAMLASMIDLTFLLIIFFILTSKGISLAVDRRVEPPVATNAQAPKDVSGRVTINLLKEGTVFGVVDDEKFELPTSESITAHVEALRIRNDEGDIKTKLNLRTDKQADTRLIKRVIKAAGAAGVSEVIFSSLPKEK